VVGDTVGFDKAELKPTGLDTQEYVFPEIAVEPMVVTLPEQISLSLPVAASGNGFTITVTLLLSEQPVEVTVSVKVYVVVVSGEIVGFEEVELKPIGLETQE